MDPAGAAVGRDAGFGVGSEALTDLLGIDAQELRTQVRDGATLAEIAEAQGIEVQAVIDEHVAELDERLTNAVESSRVDSAEADEKLADAEAKITDMVNNGRPGPRLTITNGPIRPYGPGKAQRAAGHEYAVGDRSSGRSVSSRDLRRPRQCWHGPT